MTRLSSSPPRPFYHSVSPPMASELALTYSSSDSETSRPSTPVESTQASFPIGDSSTNLLELTEEKTYTTENTVETEIAPDLEPSGYSYHCMMPSLVSRISNRLLIQTVIADKLETYPVLTALLQNGHYVFALFLGVYITILVIVWLPLALLSKLLTEAGVYAFILVNIIYIGRCVLRLLAFPGTNIKVYGEIELEFAKYSCKLLDGVADVLEAFGEAIKSASPHAPKSKSAKLTEWDVSDIPSAYKRAVVYRDRVLGVYWQVLHCLITQGGRGYDRHASGSSDSDFYGRDVLNACKRNLCCGINGTDENIHENSSSSADTSINLSMRTKYGNNPLVGDIGNMMNLTPDARSDGRELYRLLTSILDDFSNLIESASNLIQNIGKAQLKGTVISDEAAAHADSLIKHSAELRQFVNRIKPPSTSTALSAPDNKDNDEDIHDEESKVGADAVRHRLEENGTATSSSTLGMVQSAAVSFMAMIDPPPHKYIFGLDIIRGCFLSRYKGAKQFWVLRSGGSCFRGKGQIDVIHIPSQKNENSETALENRIPMSPRQGRDNSALLTAGGSKKRRKAVLYCNPNAGLAEVATGLGLIGGNIDPDKNTDDSEATCWTEYYISHGFDVYLFNYCGYGRSHAGSSPDEFQTGCIGSIRRLFYAVFLSFKPTSQTLKLDACAVANHILEHEGVDRLVIHGESIGGMAAAGAARAVTPPTATLTSSTGIVSLLICDRTFCNLEAVAQRLVGSWTGNAIRFLTFKSWNTDVVADFLAAKCPKICANDAADEIIHDYSSLKSGLSFAKELTRGTTDGLGWMLSPPMEYRMADLENMSMTNSSAHTFTSFQVNPPTWPSDKHLTWKEAFHFAFCAKRIGKLATSAKKLISTDEEEDGEGVEVTFADSSTKHSPKNEINTSRSEMKELVDLWNTLSCCDGLCGRPLGQAVKDGFDCTVSWLCCAVIMGSQIVAKEARKRISSDNPTDSADVCDIKPKDFDCRPTGYQRDENETMKYPIPIPSVLSYMKVCRRSKLQESKLKSL